MTDQSVPQVTVSNAAGVSTPLEDVVMDRDVLTLQGRTVSSRFQWIVWFYG